MQDWNVVVNVHERGYRKALELLEDLGPVSKTDFFNVLVMKVADIHSLMETLRSWTERDSSIPTFLARVSPVMHTFNFQSPEEFRTQAEQIVLRWTPQLGSRRFYVRMHRRGFKGRISSMETEQFLDESLMRALEKAGTPGHVAFDHPDAVIALETIGQRAGLALWSRIELEKYSLLRLD